jgi:flagellar hook assembly protein FlgD
VRPGEGPAALRGLALTADGDVALTILDLSGRKIRALVRGGRLAGSSNVTWDLRDDSGRRVPTGLYFARLQRGEQRASVRPVIVLR